MALIKYLVHPDSRSERANLVEVKSVILSSGRFRVA